MKIYITNLQQYNHGPKHVKAGQGRIEGFSVSVRRDKKHRLIRNVRLVISPYTVSYKKKDKTNAFNQSL